METRGALGWSTCPASRRPGVQIPEPQEEKAKPSHDTVEGTSLRDGLLLPHFMGRSEGLGGERSLPSHKRRMISVLLWGSECPRALTSTLGFGNEGAALILNALGISLLLRHLGL